MAEACCAPGERPLELAIVAVCPGCGQRGRPVALVTVQAQVAISLRALAASPYQFCATPSCAVVYFTAAAPAITSDQLRAPVFQKEPAGTVLICYCFGYSVGLIARSDSARREAILADIVAGTRQGQCACELRNPQGSCCLGNVRRLLGVNTALSTGEVEAIR